ncbi:MAG: DUF177 domain-containing protein [Bacteroidetes bacterium]|nr:DUF177 domain-containing protein [Bacteroidota bacterium]
MFDLKQFMIPYIGLSQGEHRFEYKINELFFEELGYSEMKQGLFKINLDLLKQSSMMTLNFEIKGESTVTCDRCLDEFILPIEAEQKLFVKFGDETHEETDEIFILSRNEQELDVAQFIYEYIILAMPPVFTHPEGECNPEIEKKLEELKPKNNNNDDIDPRWDILKNLK